MSNVENWEPLTIGKLLVPTIILAITFFMPQWYWREYQYENAYAQYHCADNGHALTMSVPQDQKPNGDASQSQQDLCTEPWWHWNWVIYWVIAGITAVYSVFSGLQWWGLRQQSEFYKRSTIATEKSNELRSIQLQQWVNIVDWSAEMTEDRKTLEIRFKIINPTNFPLTINDGHIKFGIQGKRLTYLFQINFTLSPNIPKPVQLDMWLIEQDSRNYLEDRLRIIVNGVITHTDMGPRGTNNLSLDGILTCGRFPARFDPEAIILHDQ